MYTELADWWTLLSPVSDYAEEAAHFRQLFVQRVPDALRVLELGAGGGNNAFHLKDHYQMTLVDRSADMQRQSLRINPQATHVLGDMREVRLEALFDIVFIHDAICYMTNREDLLRAMQTAYAHLAPGGLAMFVPDETRETFVADTDHGGVDEGPRGLRYLEWFWDPDPEDDTTIADYALLVREADGSVRVVQDRHIHGLFSREVWLDTMAQAGFSSCEMVRRTYEVHGEEVEIFIGRRG